ncbi:hypothetical protein N8J30_004260 [Salmonella enterica subsp. enterica serovar Newport]|nr:hypothetical protein [Salmonella enterica subsp. enterica serovar Newport]EJW0497128.1 hypothetical protein [Salmonella enterica subsp. enterica serovar Newport]ELA5318842.1 hypothetical protein [Salmonella enterica subsp. enterica serovar Newport]
MHKTNKFSRVLEPTVERLVSAEHVIAITEQEYENIDNIEFYSPEMGGKDFGKFKVTYKTPVFCELNK